MAGVAELDRSHRRVFISYARSDGEQTARRVLALAEERGLRPWLDQGGLEGGEDWWRQATEFLNDAEHLVLVLTPRALASKNVEKEWNYAREHGVQVSPVRVGHLDDSLMPRWIRAAHRYNLEIEEHRIRLLRGLEGPPNVRQVPFMAPLDYEQRFVERPTQLDELKLLLLDESGDPIATTVALRGAGGFGKTSVAARFCRDDRVRDAFHDGILWITRGEKPGDAVSALGDLTEALTGERPTATGLDRAKEAFVRALDDRRCLIVIDDVWQRGDLEVFLHRGPRDRTARLITTRDDGVLGQQIRRVRVDAMAPAESGAMLRFGLEGANASTLRPRFDALARSLGHWPLLLKLANSFLWGRLEKRKPLDVALGDLESALRDRGLVGTLDPRDETDRRRSARGTLQLSMEELPSEEDRCRFQELGVFAEDADITLRSAAMLWGCDGFDSEALCSTLYDRSLLLDLDLGRGTLRLHDVIRHLLRERLAPERVTELHGLLADRWRETCGGRWKNLTDEYALRHLPEHLRNAHREDGLTRLLLDPEWMQAKLQSIGVQPLLADYRRFASDFGSASSLVGRALELSRGVLSSAPEQLAMQLLGRLDPTDASDLALCLDAARQLLVTGDLILLRPSLASPGPELFQLEGHERSIMCVAELIDGRIVSSDADGTLRVWDIKSDAVSRRFEGCEARVQCIAILPDGHIISGNDDGTLYVWDLNGKVAPFQWTGQDDRVTCITVLPNGCIVSGSDNGTLLVWPREGKATPRKLAGHKSAIGCVAALSDSHIVSGDRAGTMHVWDLSKRAKPRRLEGHRFAVWCVAALPDGRIISGGGDRALLVWDCDTVQHRLLGHEGAVTCVAMLPDGRIISGGGDGSLRVWDLSGPTVQLRLTAHGNGVRSLAVLRDGRIVSGGGDGVLRVWDLGRKALSRRLEDHPGASYANVLSDGRMISAGQDRTVRLWDLVSEAAPVQLVEHHVPLVCGAVLTDGRVVAGGSSKLWVWDLSGQREPHELALHKGQVTCVAALPDCRIVSGDSNAELILWDLGDKAEPLRLKGHSSWITCVAALPDGGVASGDFDGELLIFSLRDRAQPRRLKLSEDAITSVAVLPDGSIVSGDDAGVLRICDLNSHTATRRIGGHAKRVTSIAVLPDGRIISGGGDRTLRLWSAASAEQESCLYLDATPVVIVPVSPKFSCVFDSLGRLHRVGFA